MGVPATSTAPAGAAERDDDARFVREVVRRGDVDRDQYHIEHVLEAEYRLKWLGLLEATPDGRFGPRTVHAVKRFQRQVGLRATGVVNRRTWRPLIRLTVRGERLVPEGCQHKGWHACYDRSRHQLNLYHRGRLQNSWLVRGGSSTTPTRTGTFTVYWRDIDHRSGEFGGAPMPYSQFFSGGEALHGSRSMMDPFEGHSHGCVNLYVEDARQLWRLTSEKKLRVHVYGHWD
jgi:hypothetical protein